MLGDAAGVQEALVGEAAVPERLVRTRVYENARRLSLAPVKSFLKSECKGSCDTVSPGVHAPIAHSHPATCHARDACECHAALLGTHALT